MDTSKMSFDEVQEAASNGCFPVWQPNFDQKFREGLEAIADMTTFMIPSGISAFLDMCQDMEEFFAEIKKPKYRSIDEEWES